MQLIGHHRHQMLNQSRFQFQEPFQLIIQDELTHIIINIITIWATPIVSVSASKSPNKKGASADVEPFAPSSVIFNPSKLTSIVDFK